MNKPVAWMQEFECSKTGQKRRRLEFEQIGINDIPLYTQEQLEEARKLGMQQERALWNLSESTQEFESFDRTASHMAGEYVSHPAELTDEKIEEVGIKVLGSIWNCYDEELVDFARAILRKAQDK